MEKEKMLLLLDDSEFVLDTDSNNAPLKELRIGTDYCDGKCFSDCQVGNSSQCTMRWAPW